MSHACHGEIAAMNKREKPKDEIPPEIALLLEKRELEDRRKATPASRGQRSPAEGAAPPNKGMERRRRKRRKS
jgi:hypothetical protein